ncbi:STAS domain-containing protein [Azotosporobacter soli]|jgi:anti-anti-sigma factor|uniref:STAS domain-containing protein n=1 Tax=Azotosporobacter soli TaxID=3055040 RepID=UPI0031FF38C9
MTDNVKCITVLPRVDSNNAKQVEEQLLEAIQGGAQKLICDFSDNSYISSAGLRVFLSAMKLMTKSGGQLVICSLSPFVREVFDMAGFSQIFTICSNKEEALAAVN